MDRLHNERARRTHVRADGDRQPIDARAKDISYDGDDVAPRIVHGDGARKSWMENDFSEKVYREEYCVF